MSTRATIHFQWGETDEAIVYRHGDGYPECAGVDLWNFIREVQDNLADTRFDDPTYLAARYVVWLAQSRQGTHPMDFHGIGVMLSDPPDIAYRYSVSCSPSGVPVVKCYHISSRKYVPIPTMM